MEETKIESSKEHITADRLQLQLSGSDAQILHTDQAFIYVSTCKLDSETG